MADTGENGGEQGMARKEEKRFNLLMMMTPQGCTQ
jgi:hypothetical protein